MAVRQCEAIYELRSVILGTVHVQIHFRRFAFSKESSFFTSDFSVLTLEHSNFNSCGKTSFFFFIIKAVLIFQS